MVGLTCPHCGEYIDLAFNVGAAARAMGSRTSEAKAAAVRENGKKGGRPPKHWVEVMQSAQAETEELMAASDMRATIEAAIADVQGASSPNVAMQDGQTKSSTAPSPNTHKRKAKAPK
jgi:uncharacterized membrane protein YqiK